MENEQLRSELGSAKQVNIENNTYITNKYETRINEMVQEKSNLETKYNDLLIENRRLEDLLREKDDTLKRMKEIIDSQENDSKKIYNEYTTIYQQYDTIVKENARLEQDIKRVNELEVEKRTLLNEIHRLNELVRRL